MANEIFVKGLQSKYDALNPKNATTLYFTTDTRALYVGGDLYTEAIRFYTGALPTTPATGVLYFNTDTGLGSAWNGSAWKSVLKPTVTVIDDGATDDMVATALAVKNFVEAAIEDAIEEVTGGDAVVAGVSSKAGTNGTLEVTKGDGSKVDAPLTGVAHDPVYDNVNLKLTIPVVGGTDVVVNIPKDNFVESGEYDTDTKELVLTMKQGGEVRIPAADLVDVYTSGSGVDDTITVTVGSDNKISASFKVDTTGVLNIAADGQLTIDLSGYATVTRVADVETAIGTLNADENTVGSVKKSVADALQAAKDYADNLDDDMDTRMDTAEGAITTLNGNAQTAGSVAKAVADAVSGMTEVTDAIDGRLETVEASLIWGTLV